jgi:hypothetical protein
MNIQTACILLEIDPENITPENIKKQYRYFALLYHPDKNKSEYATKLFQQINEAYRFLTDLKNRDHDDDDDDDIITIPTYKTLLREFMKHIFHDNDEEKYDFFITIITDRISKLFSEDKILEFIEKLEYKYIELMDGLFTKYKDIFYFSDSFFEKMKKLRGQKGTYDSNRFIILTPTLDDLFENNCYKLHFHEKTFIIPLWQHELVYDTDEGELYVQCVPTLPEHVTIDEENNLYMTIELNTKDLLEMNETFQLNLGNTKTMDIPISLLSIRKKQKLVLENQGISMNNVNDIYDVSVKSHIILDIRII